MRREPDGVVALPSGRRPRLFEVVPGPDAAVGAWVFRFVDETLGPEIDVEMLEPELALLCRAIALPALAEAGASPGRIVIALSDRETEFGQPVPGAVQVFESYSISGGTCRWEPF